MVFIDAHLLIGAIVQVKRTDGSWSEAVITDASTSGIGLLSDVGEDDFFVLQLADGSTKRVLMQQDLSSWFRPVDDLQALVTRKLDLLGGTHIFWHRRRPLRGRHTFWHTARSTRGPTIESVYANGSAGTQKASLV